MLRRYVMLVGIVTCGFECELAGEADRSVIILPVSRAECECSHRPSESDVASRVLTVRLLDSMALVPDIREAITEEIVRLWAGQRMHVFGAVQADSTVDGETIYVLFRPGVAPAHGRPKPAGRPEDDVTLAWTLFQQNQPASLVFVWIGAVQRLLDNSSIEGRPLTHWHADLRRALLARALGRVAAHELGHLICGRAHAPGGLMKRRFTTDDLLWKTRPLATKGPRHPCRDVTPR